jgi:hypothetical protein
MRWQLSMPCPQVGGPRDTRELLWLADELDRSTRHAFMRLAGTVGVARRAWTRGPNDIGGDEMTDDRRATAPREDHIANNAHVRAGRPLRGPTIDPARPSPFLTAANEPRSAGRWRRLNLDAFGRVRP